MVVMETNKKMCAGMEAKLAEMLLDPELAPAAVKEHVGTCDGCRSELEELRATMTALDAWEAPAPNPYFMTRFEARLREEKQKAKALIGNNAATVRGDVTSAADLDRLSKRSGKSLTERRARDDSDNRGQEQGDRPRSIRHAVQQARLRDG